MLLKEWLENRKEKESCIFLWFEEDELKSSARVKKELLNKEVMEFYENEEYEYMEVWLR